MKRGIPKTGRKAGSPKEGAVLKMRLSSILLIGYRNLLINKFRSLMTIGGVAVGIGIVTFLISLGFGFQEMVVREVTKDNPPDIVEVSNSNLDNFVSLDDATIGRIRDIGGVTQVGRSINTGGKFAEGDSQTDGAMYGQDAEFAAMSPLKMIAGNADFGEGSDKVVVSSRLAELLGFPDPTSIVGKTVTYDIILSSETNAEVKGDTVRPGNAIEVGGVLDDRDKALAYFPYPLLAREFGVDLAQQGKVKAAEGAAIADIRTQIENLGFVTENVGDIVGDIDGFFLVIKVVLVVFGSIIMSISAMGMLNTLSVSLLQRTKEVGILKALGAKRDDIFKMFIFEAAIISSIGGLAGLLGGYGAAKAVNVLFDTFAARQGSGSISFVSIPGYFLLAIVGFVIFLALATGLMPARRASQTHALEALRYE
ncbi:MAG: ABC transporter permease [Candidatus Moranbacteria bacterium]|nr:ABC transporter permease [Candidatus Moranbacteria bacterium]NTW46400.1 ABC transporter permease [Candidatus Moranbacteria bacterium]